MMPVKPERTCPLCGGPMRESPAAIVQCLDKLRCGLAAPAWAWKNPAATISAKWADTGRLDWLGERWLGCDAGADAAHAVLGTYSFTDLRKAIDDARGVTA